MNSSFVTLEPISVFRYIRRLVSISACSCATAGHTCHRQRPQRALKHVCAPRTSWFGHPDHVRGACSATALQDGSLSFQPIVVKIQHRTVSRTYPGSGPSFLFWMSTFNPSSLSATFRFTPDTQRACTMQHASTSQHMVPCAVVK